MQQITRNWIWWKSKKLIWIEAYDIMRKNTQGKKKNNNAKTLNQDKIEQSTKKQIQSYFRSKERGKKQ